MKCQDEPGYFVREVLGAEPEDYQEAILNDVRDYPYTAAHTGHGVGKTTTGAWVLLWFIFTHADSKVITTAPTWRQVKDLLWTEVARWARKADLAKMGWQWPYAMLDTRLEISEEWYATGESSDDPGKLEGYHAPSILYIVDEAKGVPDTHFVSMDGGMTTPMARMLLLSTPGDTSGLLYRACMGKENNLETQWRIHHVNGENSKQVSKKWVEGRAQAWGRQSALYRIRVQGLFTDVSSDTLIPASHWEAAISRSLPPVRRRPIRVMAVDVARYGSDSTILGWREGNAVQRLQKFDRQSLEKTADMVYDQCREIRPDVLIIDEIGVGAGVLDNLQSRRRSQLSARVVGFNAGRLPLTEESQKLFYNRRAEVYWRLRDLFAMGNISVPNDESLGLQLTEMRYEYVGKGHETVLKMVSKEELRRKGKPSPDEADTVSMLFADDELGAREGVGVWV